MALDLSAQAGVDNTDPNYLNGKIVNGATKAGEGINQDIIQFFQKLMDEGGYTASGDRDNEANGYQFVQALETVVRAYAATTGSKGTVEKATAAEVQAGTADKFVDGATFQSTVATTTTKGVVEKAIAAEAKAFTADKYPDSAGVGEITGGLLTKYIEIGSYDMTGALKQVAHGLTFAKIIGIKYVNIFNDALTSGVQLNSVSNTGALGGGASYDATNVSIVIDSGGLFDSTDYDGTGFNRGFIAIDYIP